MGRPRKDKLTTSIRIDSDTHQQIVDVAAALRLKRRLRVTPTMDDVIRESLTRFVGAELGSANIQQAAQ